MKIAEAMTSIERVKSIKSITTAKTRSVLVYFPGRVNVAGTTVLRRKQSYNAEIGLIEKGQYEQNDRNINKQIDWYHKAPPFSCCS